MAPLRHGAVVGALALVLSALGAAPALADGDPPGAAVVAPSSSDLGIDGSVTVGETVTVQPHAELWTPPDGSLTFTYAWDAGGTAIADANGASLVVPPEAFGEILAVTITGKAADETFASVTVESTGAVAAGTFLPVEPTLSGTAKVGQVLTADPGTWPAAAVLGYVWLRDGVEIGGQSGPTYTLTPADFGHAVGVRVAATAEGFNDASADSRAMEVDAGLFTAPTPTVRGTVQVGKTVQAIHGTWSPTATFSYQWYHAGKLIAGATDVTYTLTGSDYGKSISVKVTGHADGYTDASRTSAKTALATVGTLTAPTPTISGTVRVGTAVKAASGTWTSDTTLTYQWRLAGKNVSGATEATFTPSAVDKGKSLSVVVTGKLAGYTTKSVASAGETVGTGVFSTAPTPTIRGTVQVGKTVQALHSTWSPTPDSYAYQWRIDGVAISGATQATLIVPAAARGKSLSVTVKAAKAGYTTKSVTSAAVAVTALFAAAPAPTISGSLRVGSTLTAKAGAWSPTPSFTYQWKRSGTAISGATKSTYKLTGADYGKTITVIVTGTKSTYVTTSKASAATVAVGKPAAVIAGDGTYKVGTDIQPGTYVSTPTSSAISFDTWCYWERRSNSSDDLEGIIANDIAFGSQIVTISSTDKYFYSGDCGTWTPYYALGTSVKTSTGAYGTYHVGTGGGQLKPGTYETTGPVEAGGNCYVALLSGFSGSVSDIALNDNYSGPAEAWFTADSGVVGFETQGCTWTRVGNAPPPDAAATISPQLVSPAGEEARLGTRAD